MNITQYLQYEFCTTTESMLSDRIKLAEALEKYQNGNFNVEQKSLFEDCVQKTILGEYDRYSFSDEMVKKLFHFSSQSKIKLYKQLIFFEAGKRLSGNTDNLSLKLLDEYGDKMDYGFYLSYTISEAKLNKLIHSIRPISILKESRSCIGHRNDVYIFCEKEIKKCIRTEDIISLITPYNDGSYIELPEYIRLLSHLLLRDKRYSLWVTLLTKVKYFPLQGALLYHIRTLQEFMSIFQELKRPNIIHRKVILHLLRDRYFHIISKQPQILHRGLKYLIHNRKGNYGIIYKRLLDEWNNDISSNTDTVFKYLSIQLGISNCSEWYSKKNNQYINGDKRFVEYEQKAIEEIGKIMSDLSNPAKWNVSITDINTLLYYISQTEIKQITTFRSKLLVQTLFDRLYNNSSYYHIQFNDESFKLLRQVYKCLVQSKLDPFQMLQSVRYANEGYNSDYKQVVQTRRGDTFWLSMLLLGTGEQENEPQFMRYVKILLDRVLAHVGDAKEYILPLYIAELVVTQVLKKRKADFETCIINNIPNLGLVLTTLLANQGDLSLPVKEILFERISEEWDIEKKLMLQKNDSNLNVLNDYVQMVKIRK